LTITVISAIPIISSSLSQIATIGVIYSYSIIASSSPTSYGATTLPAGLTFNSVIGVISGSPTVLGVFSVNISAMNAGGTGNSNLVITINPPTPVINSSLS
jgi:hypothetical protein